MVSKLRDKDSWVWLWIVVASSQLVTHLSSLCERCFVQKVGWWWVTVGSRPCFVWFWDLQLFLATSNDNKWPKTSTNQPPNKPIKVISDLSWATCWIWPFFRDSGWKIVGKQLDMITSFMQTPFQWSLPQRSGHWLPLRLVGHLIGSHGLYLIEEELIPAQGVLFGFRTEWGVEITLQSRSVHVHHYNSGGIHGTSSEQKKLPNKVSHVLHYFAVF